MPTLILSGEGQGPSDVSSLNGLTGAITLAAGAGISLTPSGNTITAAALVTSVFSRTGAVTATTGDYTVAQITGAAPLASPALSGTPTAPTATLGTNTTQIATTAFVLANGGGSTLTFAPLNLLSAGSDAIPPHAAATYIVTTAGVDAMTLAAPTATTDDGKVITVISNTNNSHTITATGLFNSGVSAAVNLATFNAFHGATIILMAYQGRWMVLSLNGVVMS